MTKLTAESSIADIAARFNELNGSSTDVKTLAKRGKAKHAGAVVLNGMDELTLLAAVRAVK